MPAFWNRKTEARLIVGLGNPGTKYAGNRHNIGFMCIDYFAQKQNLTFARSRSQAKIAEGRIAGYDTVLAKPQTFMNNSGVSVGSLVRKHKVKIENLIVIHDDLDLPQGRIRIRLGGSSGGHKGINSIVEHLDGNQEFVRVRVGIGRPNGSETSQKGEDGVISYVLGDFTAEEKKILDKVIPCVSEALDSLLADGLTIAMNKFNSTDFRK
ncbi:MAG: aminoacyl-tRNA hydrolase [Dehalococcoidales bacterium]|nr:aminoacyl-tRNA hydrolase [Dehalococcoidales bacterium]